MSRPTDDRTPPPPTYVALPAAGYVQGSSIESRSHARLDLKRVSGRLDLRVTTLDPVHIGSGVTNFFASDELARDLVVQKRGGQEVPVLPGSSLKGAVRSIAEAIGGGCDLTDARCDPACAVCAIFGHLLREGGYLGRAGFDDAYPEDPAAAVKRIGAIKRPVAFQPRVRRGRRIYRPAAAIDHAPVPYVVVDRGVSFLGALHVRNLMPEEVGLVLLAAGADGSFRLRIGGGKFASLGRIEVDLAGAALRRGYDQRGLERLDADGARALARQAMQAVRLPPRGNESLRMVRATLGGP